MLLTFFVMGSQILIYATCYESTQVMIYAQNSV